MNLLNILCIIFGFSALFGATTEVYPRSDERFDPNLVPRSVRGIDHTKCDVLYDIYDTRHGILIWNPSIKCWEHDHTTGLELKDAMRIHLAGDYDVTHKLYALERLHHERPSHLFRVARTIIELESDLSSELPLEIDRAAYQSFCDKHEAIWMQCPELVRLRKLYRDPRDFYHGEYEIGGQGMSIANF